MGILHLTLPQNVHGHKATSGALNGKSFSNNQAHMGPQTLRRGSWVHTRISWMPGTCVPPGRFHRLVEAPWALPRRNVGSSSQP